ncbi:MAG: restriction endonuclease [Acidobacteria bacterium]|nr:restriction endonuclease [Acidobacteriota bacterium]
MKLAAVYSFNNGEKVVTKKYADLLVEINDAIKAVDASQCKNKESKEKTMHGQMLYSPKAMNRCFKKEFAERGWERLRVDCEYSTTHYLADYKIRQSLRGAYREIDFLKKDKKPNQHRKPGVEVQFGKYSFMVYNVCAKMTIFKNLGYIDAGVEVVPVKTLVEEMSTGVSYFEQFVWDLEQRGVANIDIPVLILGIDA